VLLGKLALRLRVAVTVQEALDLAHQHRLVADAVDEPVQVHRHARLVAVGVRVHDAVAVGVDLEDRPDGRVHLGVHQHDVLAVRNRVERHARAVFDVTRGLDDRLDATGTAGDLRVVRHRIGSRFDRGVELGRRADRAELVDSRFAVGPLGLVRVPVHDDRQPQTGKSRQDLEGDAAPHVAGSHESHADGIALLQPLLQCRVDDDHFEFLRLASMPA
jgi:hypothetical protein